MILADVNALVYAFRSETQFHQLARDLLTAYRDHNQLIVLTDVAAAFIRIVTDSRLSVEPDDPHDALMFIEALTSDANMLREPRITRWGIFRAMNERTDIRGALVPDALLAATSLDFGAAILTADRDFLGFPGVRVQLMTSMGIIDHAVT